MEESIVENNTADLVGGDGTLKTESESVDDLSENETVVTLSGEDENGNPVFTISGNNAGGDIDYSAIESMIIENAYDDSDIEAVLVSIDEKLLWLLVFVCFAFVWCVWKLVYKFVNGLFSF